METKTARKMIGENQEFVERFKVWEITDKNGMAEVKMSNSRKLKDNDYDRNLAEKGVAKNGYVSTYYSFVRFVGHAYNKLKQVNIGDTITDLVMAIEMEPYWDSNTQSIAYPKNPKFTVFEFEIEGASTQPTRNLDKAPQVADSPVAPVSTPVAPVAPVATDNGTADDECPF